MSRFRRPHALVFPALILPFLAVYPAAAQVVVPDGFVYELHIPGPFDGQPLGLTWLPDHRVLVLEKQGGVRIAPAGGGPSVNILTIPNVSAIGEGGLLGVAVDPDWPTRPYVYFYYSQNTGTNRIVMYTASGDLTDSTSTSLSLGSPFELLHIPDNNPAHNGGALEFGNDGMLYASCGDDNGDRCVAQDSTSLLGKIYRLDVSAMPDSGSGPPPKADITPADNPFPGATDNEKLLYVMGFRNPYRFLFDPLTGDMYVGDVGGTQFEEVDRVPAASGGGQNFGWPVREGFGLPENPDTCGQSNTMVDPIYDYAHLGQAASIIGGPLYRGVPGSPLSFPASYDGSYFFFDFNSGDLRRIVDTGGVWSIPPPVPGQPSPGNWGEGFFQPVDFREGPDGALYMTKFSADTLGTRGFYRVRPAVPTSVAPQGTAGELSVFAAPNPARVGEGTLIRWTMARGDRGSLRVYDVAGRAVRTLLDRELGAGPGSVRWDGRTESGALLPSGSYVYLLETASGSRASGRLLLLR